MPYMIYRLKKPSTYTTCYCIEFGQTLWPLLRNLSCSQDQDHVHSTYICCSYTRSTQKHVFIHSKMFYSYTRNRHKNKFVRINAPSSCVCLSWKVSIAEKEAWAMQKLFMKEKRKYWKNGQVSKISKTMGLRCPPKKRGRKMNKIAHVFLQSIFKFQTREICFNKHSRIRIATIYISTHMHILI